MKTIQLRRYHLLPGKYDEFVAWWQEWMPKVRAAGGFTIEFAYGVREIDEFVWAVSAPGTVEDFVEREKAYMASPERAAAFDGVGKRLSGSDIHFVENAQM